MPETVVELPSVARARTCPPAIPAIDWTRSRDNVAEIVEALGLPLSTPCTHDTPERFLHTLFEVTSGYDGDPKLVTTFPVDRDTTGDAPSAQGVEGPITFSALCEHHALPFFGYAHVVYRDAAMRREFLDLAR